MAASANNIAATFASAGKISSKLQSSSIPTSTSLSMTTYSPTPSLVWNPQAKLSPSTKAMFVDLYGRPGPKRKPFLTPRSKTLDSSTSPPGLLQSTRASVSISVGDKLPDATLSYLDDEENLQTVTISDLTRGKKIVLFSVPGAFTPTCSQKHLPGFVEKSDELKDKGIDNVVCISVNDVFVMKAWGEDLNVGDKVLLLADGNGVFTKLLGMELDLSDKSAGLGIRSRRYALVADNGVVKVLKVEDGGAFTDSGADDILKALLLFG